MVAGRCHTRPLDSPHRHSRFQQRIADLTGQHIHTEDVVTTPAFQSSICDGRLAAAGTQQTSDGGMAAPQGHWEPRRTTVDSRLRPLEPMAGCVTPPVNMVETNLSGLVRPPCPLGLLEFDPRESLASPASVRLDLGRNAWRILPNPGVNHMDRLGELTFWRFR